MVEKRGGALGVSSILSSESTESGSGLEEKARLLEEDWKRILTAVRKQRLALREQLRGRIVGRFLWN